VNRKVIEVDSDGNISGCHCLRIPVSPSDTCDPFSLEDVSGPAASDAHQ
jgi:hypothetical protein